GDQLELWLGDQRLRAFHQSHPYQAALVRACHRHRWTAQPIPDPLPRLTGDSDADARRRLVDTVKNLNRELPPKTIRFRVSVWRDAFSVGIWVGPSTQAEAAAEVAPCYIYTGFTHSNPPGRLLISFSFVRL